MFNTGDIWSHSSSNSTTTNQSFYFPSSLDLNPNPYHSFDNPTYDYSALPDASSYLIDPYSQMFTNNYSLDPSYSTSTGYNPSSMDYSSSTFMSTTDVYQPIPSMYSNSNVALPSNSNYFPSTTTSSEYPPSLSQWDSPMIKMCSDESTYIRISSVLHIIQKWMATCRVLCVCVRVFPLLSVQKKPNEEWEKGDVRFLVTSASNSSNSSTSASKQPCLVCHDNSSGYHFGAYTCESCKAFYRRVTKGKTKDSLYRLERRNHVEYWDLRGRDVFLLQIHELKWNILVKHHCRI